MPPDPVSESPARSRSVGRILPSSGAIVPHTRMPRKPAHIRRRAPVRGGGLSKRFAKSLAAAVDPMGGASMFRHNTAVKRRDALSEALC